MVKTQIQMPEALYREAKRIADEYEMSLAEVVRRALEKLIPMYPKPSQDWHLPVVRHGLRVDPFEDENWRETLHMGDALKRPPQK